MLYLPLPALCMISVWVPFIFLLLSFFLSFFFFFSSFLSFFFTDFICLFKSFFTFLFLPIHLLRFLCSSTCCFCSCWLLVWWRPHTPHTSLLLIFTFLSVFQIRVVNAFQMDLDSHMDSYDKRSRPSVISLQSLQAQRGAVSKKPMLASSPEADESASSPWFGRSESIPYADEWALLSLPADLVSHGSAWAAAPILSRWPDWWFESDLAGGGGVGGWAFGRWVELKECMELPLRTGCGRGYRASLKSAVWLFHRHGIHWRVSVLVHPADWLHLSILSEAGVCWFTKCRNGFPTHFLNGSVPNDASFY